MRVEFLGVERVRERQEGVGRAVARLGHLVERHLLAARQPLAQGDQRGVGHAVRQRRVEHGDGVGLAAELGEDLRMRHQRRAVEVQRPVLAAGEDGLGRDEIAGERQRQRLVVLPVGGERVVAGHGVEGRLGGGEIVAPDLDPARHQPEQQRVRLLAGRAEQLRGGGEVAGRQRVGEAHHARHLVAGVLRRQPVRERARGLDLAERDARHRGVGQEPEVLRIVRQRLVVVFRGGGVVVAEIRLHRREIGARQPGGRGLRRRAHEARGKEARAKQAGDRTRQRVCLPCRGAAEPYAAPPPDCNRANRCGRGAADHMFG